MAEPHPSSVGCVPLGDPRCLVNFRGVSKTGNLWIAIVRRRCPEQNARALWFASLSHFWLKWVSGSRLIWAVLYAHAAGYRLRECPRGHPIRET